MSRKLNSQYAKNIKFDGKDYTIFDINTASLDAGFVLEKLPYSLRVLFENVVRNSTAIDRELVAFKNWLEKRSSDEINYVPARVLMQDFTGVPAVVDLASMRDALKRTGGDTHKINPKIPVDLVIDHSLQIDSYGSSAAFADNVTKEIERNLERYQFLKWGAKNLTNFRVVPPGTGICHQVNLEYLAETIYLNQNENILYPDSLVGTDSHTTMINALSVLGWGVGGIEAEAAMLGQPLSMIIPEVVGVKLIGSLRNKISATDLVLTITEKLRIKGVVGKFVEFFGDGIDHLSLADRATISNMAPEYGATCGFFPIDDETLKYLRLTARNEHRVKIVEQYAKEQKIWRDSNMPEYTDIVEIDMNSIEPSLAGPKRPQDRVNLVDMKDKFRESLNSFDKINADDIIQKHLVTNKNGTKYSIGHGDVVIAAITSCTNTSNPSVMIAAGIVAKNAVKFGIKAKPWVKTSLAPGSKVVTEYLKYSGLDKYLDELGFNLVGYGCTTCIGNSGPLDPSISQIIKDQDLVVSSVLSGNRNFEGRVHPDVRTNYLASPYMVVAYALSGTVNIDFAKEPIIVLNDNKEIYLDDLLPNHEEIREYMDSCIKTEMFAKKYQDIFIGDQIWQNIESTKSDTYNWNESSTYIKNPPYFDNIKKQDESLSDIKNARLLALFGDSITTDHISPAGIISIDSPAGKFLLNQGIAPNNFNSYGSRRGNHEVMMRGTFANIRIKNQLCKGVEGGVTINHLTKKQQTIYDAAVYYKKHSIPLVIFAGKEYGTGSSRDWAAKGTNLLGVKAVIAESFERIHRSNLVCMGVLPIMFSCGINWRSLNISGDETISIEGLNDNIKPYQNLKCIITRGGNNETINVTLQIYTDNEIEYIKHGSILKAMLYND